MIESVTKNDIFENFNIYQLDTCRDFLKYIINANGRYVKGNGLTELALALGYKSPSTLSMVLTGERLPTKRLIKSLQSHFGLSKNHYDYLVLLLEKEKLYLKGLDNYEAMQKIGHYRDAANVDMVDLEAFDSISKWYYLAIKNLLSLTNDHSPQNLAWLLKSRVKPHQVQEALEALTRLKIIEKHGDQYHVVSKPFRTENNITSYAIRKYHEGMINEALNALNNERTTDRYISGLTVKIDKNKKDQAIEDIKHFLEHFNEKYASSNGESLEQLNIQLFSLNKQNEKAVLQ